MIQRIALYTVLGLVLNAVGAEHNVDLFNTWGFWSILALFWAAETITRREGYEAGMVFIATLPQEHLDKIKQEIKKLEAKD
jgi:hypothetical protein